MSQSEVMKWGSDATLKFLEIFQGYEVLWNVRAPDYNNKNKREGALKKLREELLSADIPAPDLASLRSKIKNIRATYRQELIKVMETKSSGKGTDDLYKPKLVWFEAADAFLRNVVVTRTSTSNLGEEPHTAVAETAVEEEDVDDPEDQPSTSSGLPSTSSGSTTKKRRVSKINRVEQVLSKIQKLSESRLASQSMGVKPDEYDLFAQHITAQLRQLPTRSFIELQAKFQELISQERLKYFEEREVVVIAEEGSRDDEDRAIEICTLDDEEA